MNLGSELSTTIHQALCSPRKLLDTHVTCLTHVTHLTPLVEALPRCALRSQRLAQHEAHDPIPIDHGDNGLRAAISGNHEMVRAQLAGSDRANVPDLNISLCQRGAIDLEDTVAQGDIFSGQPYNAFNHELSAGPHPDNVPAPGPAQEIGEFVDCHELPPAQGGLHALASDERGHPDPLPHRQDQRPGILAWGVLVGIARGPGWKLVTVQVVGRASRLPDWASCPRWCDRGRDAPMTGETPAPLPEQLRKLSTICQVWA